MANEEDILQLPPALRVAANSSRGRKQMEDDERMSLKNEAKATRLRLAQVGDNTDSISSIDSLYIDTTLTCPAPGTGGTERNSDSISGKYSNEILNKKIKKVEKMLNKSTPGSKEFKVLRKKLIEYRVQSKQKNQNEDSHITMDDSLNLAEVEKKEWTAEQEQEDTIKSDTIKSDTISVEIIEEERLDESIFEGYVNEHEYQKTHSLEMLKKKLKKVEKMLHKSAPGSKEHKKFQKKRIEYGKQIRMQDSIDSITGKRDPKCRTQQIEEREKILRDAPGRRSRLSWRRSLERKQKKKDAIKEAGEGAEGELEAEEVRQEGFKQLEIEAKDSLLTKGELQERVQFRYFDNSAAEKRKAENHSKPKLSQLDIHKEECKDEKTKKQAYLEEARRLKYEALEKKRKVKKLNGEDTIEKSVQDIGFKVFQFNVDRDYGEDEKAKKQAYLEEARRLKQEASEKKRKEEKLSKKNTTDMRKVEELEPNLSQSNNHTHFSEEEKLKKRAYLDEARKLKHEALEKKRKEEELQKSAEEKSDRMVEKQNPSQLGLSVTKDIQNKSSERINAFKYKFVQNDNQREKQAFLEEARRLKQEATEKKRKEEQLNKKIEMKEGEDVKENRKKTPSVGIPAVEGIQSRILKENDAIKYLFVDNGDKRRKQAYLEEARKLKKEATQKKLKESHLKKESQLEDEKFVEVKSPGEEYLKKTESIEVGEETSKLHRIDDRENISDLLAQIRSKAEEQKQVEQKNDSALKSESTLQIKKSNYLDEIKLKGEVQKDQKDSIASTDPTGRSKKPTFLDEIKSKVNVQKKDEQRNDYILSTDLTTNTKKLDLLKMIKPKVEEEKEDEQQNDSKPILQLKMPKFLEEIISKAEEQNQVRQQNVSTSSTDPSTHTTIPIFLEEIKPKAEEHAENGQQYDSNPPTTYLLEEGRSKAEVKKEDEQQNNSIPSSDSAKPKQTPNFLEEIISKAKERKRGEQQNDSRSSTDSTTSTKKPKFLEGIILKGEEQKDDEKQNYSSTTGSTSSTKEKDGQQNISTPSTNPVKTSKPTYYLEDIRSKAKEQNEDEHQNDLTLSTNFTTPAKSQCFLDEITLKAEERNVDEEQIDSTPSIDPTRHSGKPYFLEEIGSKSEEPAPKPKKPNFLEEIKSKACFQKEREQQNDSTRSTDPTMYTKKSDFLEEIKSKSKVQKGDEQQNDSTSYLDSNGQAIQLNVLEKIPLKVRKEEDEVHQSKCSSVSATTNAQQSEQIVRRGTENDYSSTKKEMLASSASQQQEASEGYLDKRTLPEPFSNNTKKILRELESNEIRQKKLERSLMQNGISVTEDVPYEVAKDKITEITDSMKALVAVGMDSYTTEKEYFRLEEQLSKYTTALMLTDEYAEEHRRMELDWEESVAPDNIVAIRKLRSHMPVKIRHLTEDELVTSTTPNGKILPKSIARKFKRTNILQLLRVDPNDIEMMHPSLLEGMRTTGLTLTERRALHEHFRDVVERWTEKRSDPSIEKKCQWYQMLKSKFKETLTTYLRCVEQFGPPGSHQYAKRGDPKGSCCPLLGKQCPIKADAIIDYNDDYGYTKEATYENSGNRSDSKKESIRCTSLSKVNSSKGTNSSEQEILQEYRDRLRFDTIETDVDKKLLRELFHSEKRTKTLEKQLTRAGLSLPKEDVSYNIAKTRVAELTKELNIVAMNMGNTSDAKRLSKLEHTFGQLSQELDKYTNALMLTKEWVQEQKEKEREWEIGISAANYEALQKVRRHMPVNIRNMSESSLATDLTPNGKVLPKAMAKKFKRTNILMILRTDPSVIEVMHPSSLESMRTAGLTLTERRALHEHLKDIAPKWKIMTSDKMCQRKWMWHASLQSKFKEMLEKYDKHVDKYGHPGNHPDRDRNDSDGVGRPLIANQCPIRADLATDYSGDYGYPDNAEYEQQIVAKSNLLSMEELEKRKL